MNHWINHSNHIIIYLFKNYKNKKNLKSVFKKLFFILKSRNFILYYFFLFFSLIQNFNTLRQNLLFYTFATKLTLLHQQKFLLIYKISKKNIYIINLII